GATPAATSGLSAALNNPAQGRGASPIAGAPGLPGAGAAGGIIGVTSKSKDKSILLYKGRGHYNEWAFVYTQQTQAPGVGAPGTIAPGQRGQPTGAPGSPFGPGGRGRGRGQGQGPGQPRGEGRFGPANPTQRPGPGGSRGRGPDLR